MKNAIHTTPQKKLHKSTQSGQKPQTPELAKNTKQGNNFVLVNVF